MLPVYQAFDRVKFSEVPTDDARALEDKLERASRAFGDRDGCWLRTSASWCCASSRALSMNSANASPS